MKWGYILEKTSTVKSRIDIDYLDETSDLKASYTQKNSGETIKEVKNKTVQKLNDIEYLTKEEQGQVHAGGFLRDQLLSKGGPSPGALDNNTRKKKITRAISKHISEFGRWRGACAHKIVLSMDAKMNKKIKAAGLNPDKVLISHMKKIMRDFQIKFHPGDRIGYAYGLHHDTDNLHAHIYLVNRTENGKHVGFSKPLKGKVDKQKRNNHMGFCNDRLNKITADFCNKLDQEITIKETNLQAIKAAQIKQIQMMEVNNLLAISLRKRYKKLIDLEHKIVNKFIPPSFRTAKMGGMPYDISRALGQGRRQAFIERKALKKEYFALKRKYFYDLAVYNNREGKIGKLGEKIENKKPGMSRRFTLHNQFGFNYKAAETNNQATPVLYDEMPVKAVPQTQKQSRGIRMNI